MKSLLLFLISLPSTWALTPSVLKTGDVLLQSVNCKLCALIELEEHAPYSHIGVVVVDAKKKVTVIDSYGEVEQVPLAAFLSKRKNGAKTLVLRPVDAQQKEIRISADSFLAEFQKSFAGRHYDDAFLWDNSDAAGEKLYCSELVAKLLNHYLPAPIPTKPMHYTEHRAEWEAYFNTASANGLPPDGLPGISPGDFVNVPAIQKVFKTVGKL